MRQALVTGGLGFIGSHLVRALVAQGRRVRVLDSAPDSEASWLADFPEADLRERIEVIHGDVRDEVTCRKACWGVDVVFHLAAMVSVPMSVDDPLLADAINTTGTLNLLVAARDCHVRRVVFSSSAAVYGDTSVVPVHEDVPTRPTSPYGIQKLTGEHYARTFTALYGLETVCLRYFNVYGPGQKPGSAYAAAVPALMTRLLSGQAPTIFGDGEQTRDFCFVQDVVQANLLAAQTTRPEALGAVFNIAGGTRTSLNQLYTHMADILATDLPPHYAPERAGDIRHSGADISRAQALLGYAPRYNLCRGIEEAAPYYLEIFGSPQIRRVLRPAA